MNKNYNKQGNYLKYKNYIGSIELSEEDAVFHGKVIGIKALISFEGNTVETIINDFHKAIDEYLQFCSKKGIEPEKPFKGSFDVRLGTELHRKLALTAFTRGITINTLVKNAIRQSVGI